MNSKIKFVCSTLKNKADKAAFVGSLVFVSIDSAFAAEGDVSTLPAGAQSALDQITGFADSMIAWAWPVVGTILGASITIKLLKKLVSKAT